MSLMINGTNIPNSGDFVKVGNTNLTKVVCNGKTVWEKQQDISLSSGNLGGLPVSGVWTGSVHSYNGDKDGTKFYITINNINLTPYKRIVANVCTSFAEATASNGVGYWYQLSCGGLETDWKALGSYHHGWGGDEDYSPAYNLTAEIVLNVSSLSGIHSVTLCIWFYHNTNHIGEGNGDATYRIDTIQLLTY